MSAAFIEVKMTGDNVLAKFTDVVKTAALPFPMLDEVGAFLDSDVIKRGRESRAPDGTTWLPSQRALDEGGKTLIDKNILIDGATHNVVGNLLTHGLTEEYAAIHQFGGQAGRGKRVTIPQREIIGISESQQSRIDKILLRWAQSWFD